MQRPAQHPRQDGWVAQGALLIPGDAESDDCSVPRQRVRKTGWSQEAAAPVLQEGTLNSQEAGAEGTH